MHSSSSVIRPNSLKILALCLLVFALVLSSLSCSKEEPAESEPEEPSQSQATTSPTRPPETTGTEAPPEPEADLLFPDRYPLAFMVNNAGPARPQSGLAKAKLIYQILTEGRTSRFLLVTDAEEGVVGPVRSARPAFLDLVAQHQAFYAYAGNYNVIEASSLVNTIRILDALKGFYGIYYRSSHRQAPHNLYCKLETAYKRAESSYGSIIPPEAIPGPRVYRESQLPDGGQAVAELDYRYSSLKESFKFDADKNCYYKYNDGTVLVDEQSGEKLEISNIIVLHRPHSLMPNGVHVKVNWVDKAEAVYLTGGEKFDISWEKESHTAPMLFYLAGEELILNPGLTWIIVVDDSALSTVAYR